MIVISAGRGYHLGPAGEHGTTHEVLGEAPSPLTIHNDRAKRKLGWPIGPTSSS